MATSENQLASVRVGKATLSLAKGEEPARNGQAYFDFRYEPPGARPSAFRVWANELPWVVGALTRVCQARPFPDAPPEGTYPLAVSLSASGGPGFVLYSYDGAVSLVLRRFKASWKPNGDTESQFTRFFVYDKFQLRVPWSEKNLAEFAAQASTWLREFSETSVRASGKAIPDPSNAFERLVVFGTYGGTTRRMMLTPGLDIRRAEFDVLPDDVVPFVLKACAAPVGTDAIPGLLHNALDAQAVRSVVSWPHRYSGKTLGAGYVLNAHDAKRFSAARSVESFASDPLLTSLAVAGKPRPQKGPLASVPQCTEAMLKAAVAKGNCAGFIESRFGDIPIPSDAKTAEIRRLLAPAVGLGMHRWKVIQLLELESACSVNAPANDPAKQLLDVQRLRMCISDAKTLFETAPREIERYVDAAERRIKAILAGERSFAPYQSMPKKEGGESA